MKADKSNNCEYPRQALYQFHDMIYFMVVTVTTVGYGDIAPVTMEGRMSVIVIIMVIIGLFPNQYSELSRINSLTSKYERDSLKKRSN